jgi:hypothetical protein
MSASRKILENIDARREGAQARQRNPLIISPSIAHGFWQPKKARR